MKNSYQHSEATDSSILRKDILDSLTPEVFTIKIPVRVKDDTGTPSDEKKPLKSLYAVPTHINENNKKKQKDKVQRVYLVNSDSKNEFQPTSASKSRHLQARQKMNNP